MENEKLLESIVKAKAKIIVLLEQVLAEPRKHITTLSEYKKVKKLVKTLNDEGLNNKWQEVSRNLYNYLYQRQYYYIKKEEELNGSSKS